MWYRRTGSDGGLKEWTSEACGIEQGVMVD